MKTLHWIRFLEEQARRHGKSFFRVAELANVAGRDPHALNVELGRLIRRGVLVRYATGVYGLPGCSDLGQLVRMLDRGAYMTGFHALYCHHLVTQQPTEIVCFTNRRHNRSRVRQTPLGRLVFVYKGPAHYRKPPDSHLAAPIQALCDYVHQLQQQGADPRAAVTFRNLHRLNPRRLQAELRHYAPRVAAAIRELFDQPPPIPLATPMETRP